ncbi:MAG TPA: response regulator [Methylomirabilota bacterium]|nr:response regulator [Methylomirabilota bacterium]
MSGDEVVYVVDDEETVRRSLSRLLRSAGLTVQTFPSAQAFLDQAPTNRPGCLVLDVRLPDLSGLDLQITLGSRQATLPIIFITGRGSIPMSVQAMKGGALDFLRKPVEADALLDAIHRALARSRAALTRAAAEGEVTRRLAKLTPREREVLDLVVTGRLNKQIAAELGAAEKTVKVHRGRVMKKMEAESVADLIRMTQTVERPS